MREGGKIFLLKMGKPVKIDNLARDLITLSGKTIDKDIKIIYTELRPGEKLYEKLITPLCQSSFRPYLLTPNA